VFACGFNNDGRLGLGDVQDRDIPQQVIGLAGKCVQAVACGSDFMVALLGLDSTINLISEWDVMCSLAESGELFTWGNNRKGQLGLGDNRGNRKTPQQVMRLDGKQIKEIACGGLHAAAVLGLHNTSSSCWFHINNPNKC
jgi:alpha-tubulin suppressor-like RCC1 family protein